MNTYIIRLCTKDDLPQVAEVHKECFPDSFSTALGAQNLILFYDEYLKKASPLFLVAEMDSKIIGFGMGYFCESNTFMHDFLRNNRIRLFFRYLMLAIIGNKAFYKKVFSRFQKDTTKDGAKILDSTVSNTEHTKCTDLLSICVLHEYRGKRVANDLIQRFEEQSRNEKREKVLLSVALDNNRGISFYKKNGYDFYKLYKDSGRMYKNL